MKTGTLALAMALCAGCTIANQAQDWPRKYTKPGVDGCMKEKGYTVNALQ